MSEFMRNKCFCWQSLKNDLKLETRTKKFSMSPIGVDVKIIGVFTNGDSKISFTANPTLYSLA